MSGSERKPEAHLPLKHREFLMLLVLAQGARHGYVLKQELHDRSDGRIDLGPGTLYRTIRALDEDALIRETDERPEDDDPRRIYYELTDLGRETLAAEARRLEGLVRDARAEKVIP